TYCIGCHGEQGDGKGPAAPFLDPKPRNFGLCRVKFAGVAAGEQPRDLDYDQIITGGLKGTAMPSFKLLGIEQRAATIAYVGSFCTKPHRPGAPIALGPDPWRRQPERGVAEGERVYHGLARCWSCHPAYVGRAEIGTALQSYAMPAEGVRPNVYVGELKDSDW